MVAAGTDAVHLHVKDDQGADTLGGGALLGVLAAVRRAAPGVPVRVSTGAWAVPDPAERVAAVRSWTEVPDFASVNWHEHGAEDVAAALLGREVGVEAGLWQDQAVDTWLASPLRDRCLRALLELPDGLDAAATQPEAAHLLEHVRAGTSRRVPVLLHGEGSSSWPGLACAGRWGCQPGSDWRTRRPARRGPGAGQRRLGPRRPRSTGERVPAARPPQPLPVAGSSGPRGGRNTWTALANVLRPQQLLGSETVRLARRQPARSFLRLSG